MDETRGLWRGVTRRELIRRSSAALAATASLSACDLLSTDPTNESESEQTTKGKEAPSLAKAAEAGDLPPLEERLPATPLVVEPEENIGVYGGEWLTCITNVGGSECYENIGYDALTRWDTQWTKVEPNVAESWDVEDDGRVYVFHLREGMKWSDGKPFTADDVVFAFDSVIANTELTPTFPEWLLAGGKPPTIEKIDDVTFQFVFAEPHGLLPEWLATPSGASLTALPKHFLSEFHADFNDNIEQLTKDEGFDTWLDLFAAKGGLGPNDIGAWQVAEFPTLYPWKVTTALTQDRLVAERNPYYWKTDPDGSQLPYLDRAILQVVADPEVVVVQITEGRYSLPVGDVLIPSNKPVLAESRETSGYSFVEMRSGKTNYTTLVFNQNSQNPVLREIFQQKDFRIGLSHAINREEIRDTVYQQQGEPWQSSPRKEGDFYHEQLAKQYTEFDLDLAAEHLDKSGFTERDGDGFRLGPDGKRIAFTIEVPIGFDPTWPDVMTMVKTYWEAEQVGVEMRVKNEQTDLFFTRMDANQHDAVAYSGENGLIDAILDPRWYFPYSGASLFATQWAAWYNSSGEAGEEPPAGPKQQMELYDEIRSSTDPEHRRERFMELLQICADEFYVIGTVLFADGYQVVQNDFKNVPKSFPNAWLYPDPAPLRPEQYYRES